MNRSMVPRRRATCSVSPWSLRWAVGWSGETGRATLATGSCALVDRAQMAISRNAGPHRRGQREDITTPRQSRRASAGGFERRERADRAMAGLLAGGEGPDTIVL